MPPVRQTKVNAASSRDLAHGMKLEHTSILRNFQIGLVIRLSRMWMYVILPAPTIYFIDIHVLQQTSRVGWIKHKYPGNCLILRLGLLSCLYINPNSQDQPLHNSTHLHDGSVSVSHPYLHHSAQQFIRLRTRRANSAAEQHHAHGPRRGIGLAGDIVSSISKGLEALTCGHRNPAVSSRTG